MKRYEIRRKSGNQYRIYDNAIADWVKDGNKILIFTANEAEQWIWERHHDEKIYIWC